MCSITEVETGFGSARTLTESVLGYPVAGGHATKRAVRSVGLLLHHRLGPAVTAEVLSWAASVVDVVDTATIEVLIESAIDAPGAWRPLRLAHRNMLTDPLERISHRPARRRALLTAWSQRPDWSNRTWGFESNREYRWTSRWSSYDDLDNPMEWLASLTEAYNTAVPVEPFSQRLARTASRSDQIAMFAAACADEVGEVASSPVLFELPDPIIARCLFEQTRRVLDNPTCPRNLVTMVRHPHDNATLELAVRAGHPYNHGSRIERLLRRLDAATREHYVDTIPTQFVEALRRAGLLKLDDLVGGDLQTLDLADDQHVVALFGDHRRVSQPTASAADRHPDTASARM